MKIKSVLKYVLICMGIFILGFTIIGNVLSHVYGYDDIKEPYAHKNQNLFKDSINKKIYATSIWKNFRGDSIFVFKYDSIRQIVLWVIHQDLNATFSDKIDSIHALKFPPRQVTFYNNINAWKEGHIELDSKAFSSSLEDICVHFCDCKGINLIQKSKNFQCYHLKGGYVYLSNTSEKFYTYMLRFAYGTDMDLAVLTQNHNIYIASLYTMKENQHIDSKELLKILNI